MEKVQIIPPPKDVDPRVLAWKGAAVLGKMDGVSDLWLTAADWVRYVCLIEMSQNCSHPVTGYYGDAGSQRTMFLLVKRHTMSQRPFILIHNNESPAV
jgi:hypothetical protein